MDTAHPVYNGISSSHHCVKAVSGPVQTEERISSQLSSSCRPLSPRSSSFPLCPTSTWTNETVTSYSTSSSFVYASSSLSPLPPLPSVMPYALSNSATILRAFSQFNALSYVSFIHSVESEEEDEGTTSSSILSAGPIGRRWCRKKTQFCLEIKLKSFGTRFVFQNVFFDRKQRRDEMKVCRSEVVLPLSCL